MDILKKIEQHREEEQRLKWEGTFSEYLDIIKENPLVAQSAHSRVYHMIKDSGIEEENGVRTYKFLIRSFWFRGIIGKASGRVFSPCG